MISDSPLHVDYLVRKHLSPEDPLRASQSLADDHFLTSLRAEEGHHPQKAQSLEFPSCKPEPKSSQMKTCSASVPSKEIKRSSFAEPQKSRLDVTSIKSVLIRLRSAARSCCALACFCLITVATILSCCAQDVALNNQSQREECLTAKFEAMKISKPTHPFSHTFNYEYAVEVRGFEEKRFVERLLTSIIASAQARPSGFLKGLTKALCRHPSSQPICFSCNSS